MFAKKSKKLSIELTEIIDSSESQIRKGLETALASFSAVKSAESAIAHVGSQAIFTEHYTVGNEEVVIVQETYAGIEITAPKVLALKLLRAIHV